MAKLFEFKGKIGLSRMVLEECLVPKAGLEPARISTVDFESTASTDFATPAWIRIRKTLAIIPLPVGCATAIEQRVR